MVKMIQNRIFVLAVSLLVLSGCFKEPEDIRAKEDKILREYLEANSIDAIKDPNWNYYYQELVTNFGERKVDPGDIVAIYYKIKALGSNAVIDERSPDDGNPRLVKHSNGGLIIPIGIDIGLSRMHLGDRYRFYLPSYLGYGQFSSGTELAPNSLLEVEVEVAEIFSVDQEKERQYNLIDQWIESNYPDLEPLVTISGLRVLVLEEGNGSIVEFGDPISIKYVGKFRNGTVFDQNNFGFSFTVGGGSVITGMDEGVRKLTKGGGKGILLIPSHLAYPLNPVVIPARYNNTQITGFTDLIFEVEIL
jgi:FKBP-type peptidyl-prolyl cis-trans isomerase